MTVQFIFLTFFALYSYTSAYSLHKIRCQTNTTAQTLDAQNITFEGFTLGAEFETLY